MILAGLPPEKAITLASKSIKLWRYQSEAAHLYSLSKLSDVTKKYIENKHTYEKTISKMKIKYEAEIAGNLFICGILLNIYQPCYNIKNSLTAFFHYSA